MYNVMHTLLIIAYVYIYDQYLIQSRDVIQGLCTFRYTPIQYGHNNQSIMV